MIRKLKVQINHPLWFEGERFERKYAEESDFDSEGNVFYKKVTR